MIKLGKLKNFKSFSLKNALNSLAQKKPFVTPIKVNTDIAALRDLKIRQKKIKSGIKISELAEVVRYCAMVSLIELVDFGKNNSLGFGESIAVYSVKRNLISFLKKFDHATNGAGKQKALDTLFDYLNGTLPKSFPPASQEQFKRLAAVAAKAAREISKSPQTSGTGKTNKNQKELDNDDFEEDIENDTEDNENGEDEEGEGDNKSTSKGHKRSSKTQKKKKIDEEYGDGDGDDEDGAEDDDNSGGGDDENVGGTTEDDGKFGSVSPNITIEPDKPTGNFPVQKPDLTTSNLATDFARNPSTSQLPPMSAVESSSQPYPQVTTGYYSETPQNNNATTPPPQNNVPNTPTGYLNHPPAADYQPWQQYPAQNFESGQSNQMGQFSGYGAQGQPAAYGQQYYPVQQEPSNYISSAQNSGWQNGDAQFYQNQGMPADNPYPGNTNNFYTNQSSPPHEIPTTVPFTGGSRLNLESAETENLVRIYNAALQTPVETQTDAVKHLLAYLSEILNKRIQN